MIYLNIQEIVPFQLPPMNIPALPMMNISTNCLPLSMAPLQDNVAAPSSQTTSNLSIWPTIQQQFHQEQHPMVNVGKPENCEVGMNSNRLLMGNSAAMTTLANLGSNNCEFDFIFCEKLRSFSSFEIAKEEASSSPLFQTSPSLLVYQCPSSAIPLRKGGSWSAETGQRESGQ
jgi:hypothetical protein